MHRFMKCGLSLAGVFYLLAGPAGAQESEPLKTAWSATGYTVIEYDPVTAITDPTKFREIKEGADNVFGPFTCSSAGTIPYIGTAEPPAADVEGVCDPASTAIGLYGPYDYSFAECRLENTGQFFTISLDTQVSCLSFSCFEQDPNTGDYLPAVGCTVTAFYTLTTMFEDGTATSEVEVVEKLTYEQVEFDAAQSLVVARTKNTATGTSTVTLNVPEADLPARDVALEVPGPGSTMSGIGIISGWSCLGGELEAEFSDANGEVIATLPLAYGVSRADTESVCGDTRNGFSTTMNWNLIGPGAKTVRLMQNGEALASQDFSVVAFETEFISGASGMCSVDDFPGTGESVTVEWDEPQQSFVVTEIN